MNLDKHVLPVCHKAPVLHGTYGQLRVIECEGVCVCVCVYVCGGGGPCGKVSNSNEVHLGQRVSHVEVVLVEWEGLHSNLKNNQIKLLATFHPHIPPPQLLPLVSVET